MNLKQYFYYKFYDSKFKRNVDYKKGFDDAFEYGCKLALDMMKANNKGNGGKNSKNINSKTKIVISSKINKHFYS